MLEEIPWCGWLVGDVAEAVDAAEVDDVAEAVVGLVQHLLLHD